MTNYTLFKAMILGQNRFYIKNIWGKSAVKNEFFAEWNAFRSGHWSCDRIDVRDFIQKNYTPYEGNDEFLSPPTAATKSCGNRLWSFPRRNAERAAYLIWIQK